MRACLVYARMRIDVCVFVVQLWRCRLHVFATFTHTHKYLTSSHTAREALKIVISILDKNLYIMVNNTRTAHTRLSSCKHTHSVQTLTAPRAFLPRERTRSLVFCRSLDSTFGQPSACHEQYCVQCPCTASHNCQQ